jgi:hypothetical protein
MSEEKGNGDIYNSLDIIRLTLKVFLYLSHLFYTFNKRIAKNKVYSHDAIFLSDLNPNRNTTIARTLMIANPSTISTF